MNPLAEAIKTHRTTKRWTQTQLAEASGVKQQVISKLERGKARTGSAKTLRSLGRALEVDLLPLVDSPAE